MNLLGKMAVLFVYMMIGYFCFRRNYLDARASKVISFLVLNFASPALVISGTINRQGDIPGGLFPTVLAAVCLFGGMFAVAFLLPVLLRVPVRQRGVYRLMTIFSNIGFMGFPVVQALYGEEALLHTAIFQIPYNLLIYTYGIYELTRNQKGENGNGFEWKKMINVGVAAGLLAILLYILRWDAPGFVRETLSGLGSLTAPLSMIVIGMALARVSLRSLCTDVRLLLFSCIKLLVVPVLGMLLAGQLIADEVLRGVFMVMLATPVGSMTAMLAEQYGGDTDLTGRGVALTTLLSVVTIPIVGALTL